MTAVFGFVYSHINCCKILIGKSERWRPVGGSRRRREGNIKMAIKAL
jgi:hypothetical protein